MTEKTEFLQREDTEVKPSEWEEDYISADEYSVALWFRWIEIARVPWEVIYSFTSNEPAIRSNVEKAGDRLLSLYQYADGRLFFSTHTTLANDGFKYIYAEQNVPDSQQGLWCYTYFGYKRFFGTYIFVRTFD